MEHAIKIVRASLQDIPFLVSHHRLMFEDIYHKEGLEIKRQVFDKMDEAYTKKLAEQLPSGGCLAWLALSGQKPVASGTISQAALVPIPNDPNPIVVFIHSIYTDISFRRQHCSRLIMQTIIDHCKAAGIKRLLLSTSEMAKPLYQSMGFKDSTNSMALIISD